ncbi:MAG: altronate dehydratase family protein [Spirochaetaceae bacterium]|jgi:altronate hydrolase|nr:altronate dehydratase family protein [Spirochaetaceae bacterium]
MNGYTVINSADNVAVALTSLAKGLDAAGGFPVELRDDIPAGHKFSLRRIPRGASVIKYGFPIGSALEDIPEGSHVHTHNTKTNLKGEIEYAYRPCFFPLPPPPARLEFAGYRRAGGEAGIRNEVWIIPTVGCVNETGRALEAAARERHPPASHFDGVRFFAHPYGCSQMGDDQSATQRILAGLASHPNAGGALILGLGCENNNITEFKKAFTGYDAARVRFLNIQDTEDELGAALALIGELVTLCEHDRREPFPADALRVGLKCGGSDGLSGITANPLLGKFSDSLLAAGGTTVLTEVPEMFGAETLLLNRCKDAAIFAQAADMINGFKRYYERHNQVIYENPSPGNKAGGITTLEDKSLGCVQKGGRGPVTGILRYGDRLREKGLNLLEGPGNDIVAVTALAAAHVHLILFTTGRGTPLGAPVPVIKVSTNTPLALRKKNWIDFDAGRVCADLTAADNLAAELYEQTLRTASGEIKTKNELNGFYDMAIFKNGITL